MDKRSTFMSSKELTKLRVIWDIQAKRKTQKDGAEELNLSVRQVRRLCKKVKEKGEKGIIHGLVQRTSNNTLPPSIRSSILTLWNDKYKEADLNYSHFTEKLNEIEKIKVSRECVRGLLRSEGAVDRPLKKIKKHRKKRERKLCVGEMVQIDTSPHDWLSIGIPMHAVVAVDDATSKLLYLRLYEHDGTMANMEAMSSIIKKFGLPMSFYADGAAWFKVTRNGNGSINIPDPSKVYQTQIQRALEELGVTLIIAGSPQAKGRVERANRTLQDRLISELALNGIKNMNDANKFINDYFIDDYNKRFAKAPQDAAEAFVRMINTNMLENIFCLKMVSTVRNDNTISKSKKYLIQILPTERRLNWSRAKVDVHIHLDGSVDVYHTQSKEKLPIEIKELKIPQEFKYRKTAESWEEDIFTLQKADISI
jgi:hypothetical protein